MSEKYWDEKLSELQNGISFNALGEDAIDILKQIASDQREACIRDMKEKFNPYAVTDIILQTVFINIARTAEIGLESKQNGEVKS